MSKNVALPAPPEVTVIKEGFGWKQGHKVKNWKHRFFLISIGSMSYYKSRNEEEASGVLPITTDTTVKVIDSERGDYVLEILTPAIKNGTADSILLFDTVSKRDCESWKTAIEQARVSPKILIEGVLTKQSRKRKMKLQLTNWKRRYFCALKGSLWYFKLSDSASAARDSPMGNACGVVEITTDKPPVVDVSEREAGRIHVFKLVTSTSNAIRGSSSGSLSLERQMLVAASSRTERDKWIDMLNSPKIRVDRRMSDDHLHEHDEGEGVGVEAEPDSEEEFDAAQSTLAEKLAESRKKKRHLVESGVLVSRMSGKHHAISMDLELEHVTGDEFVLDAEDKEDDALFDSDDAVDEEEILDNVDAIDQKLEDVQIEEDNTFVQQVLDSTHEAEAALAEAEEERKKSVEATEQAKRQEEEERKRSEEEEEQKRNEMEKERAERIMRVRTEKERVLRLTSLINGFSVLKHGRRGKPHKKVIFCSYGSAFTCPGDENDLIKVKQADLELKTVQWSDGDGKKKAVGKIDLKDVTEVKAGAETEVFMRDSRFSTSGSGSKTMFTGSTMQTKHPSSGCCLSLISFDRTLDIETSKSQDAKQLVEYFDYIIKNSNR